jgi:hypothetical protein
VVFTGRSESSDVSLAETTREAARGRPFLVDALRAGVVNYAAAAAFLDVEGDPDTVATALRRFADELEPVEPDDRRARVTMRRGVGLEGNGATAARGAGNRTGDPGESGEPHLRVGGVALVPEGSMTAVQASGDVDAAALEAVLGRLRVAGVDAEAAGVAGESLVVVVGRRDGARAVRAVEGALAAVRA